MYMYTVCLVPLPDLLSRMDMPASVETQLVKHLQLFLEYVCNLFAISFSDFVIKWILNQLFLLLNSNICGARVYCKALTDGTPKFSGA